MKTKGILILFIALMGLLVVGFYLVFYTGSTGSFRNGQTYQTFINQDIEIKYPDWVAIDKSRLIESDKIALAVSSKECVFVINKEEAIEGLTLSNLSDKYIQSRISDLSSRIIQAEISDISSYLYEELKGVNFTYNSFTRTYLSSGHFYKIYLISEKDVFVTACFPILEEVFGSIKINQ